MGRSGVRPKRFFSTDGASAGGTMTLAITGPEVAASALRQNSPQQLGLLISRELRGIAMVLMRGAPVHAMIHCVGIGEAMHSVAAVSEGHHRGRRDEAKRGESRGRHRYAEPKSGAELLQHG